LTRTNEHGQPIGPPMPAWTPRPWPPRTPMEGRTCRLLPSDAARDLDDLWDAFSAASDGRDWTYLPYGPFAQEAELRAWAERMFAAEDPQFWTIVERTTGRAVGVASHMRIDPANGAIEVGHIHFAPAMQRGPVGTEAMHLMMRRAFDDLGYRRCEWKCDALNGRSRAAARRFGFSFEGLFRQAAVYKGRSRDTAWFSILDAEWPAIRAGFEAWLDPGNFAPDGTQRTRLNDHLPPGRTDPVAP